MRKFLGVVDVVLSHIYSFALNSVGNHMRSFGQLNLSRLPWLSGGLARLVLVDVSDGDAAEYLV